jgi:hypothetical protein
MYKNYSWIFSDLINQNFFDFHPSKYVPEYGGYCAYALATSHSLGFVIFSIIFLFHFYFSVHLFFILHFFIHLFFKHFHFISPLKLFSFQLAFNLIHGILWMIDCFFSETQA